jgi:wobble nucleotide-excising tRNase
VLALTSPFQSTKGKKDAERAIEDSTGKIKKEKASVKKLESELSQEEEALEEITESLKGDVLSCTSVHQLTDIYRQDTGVPRPDRGQAEGATTLDEQDQ